MNISMVLVTSVAPSPSVLFLDPFHRWRQGGGIISLPQPSPSAPSAAAASLRSASSSPHKEEEKTGWKKKSCVPVFLLRQTRKSDDDAETRPRWTRVRARDARAPQAEGARISRSLLRMKGQLRFMLPPYGVKLPVKWNRLSVITRDLPQWVQSVADWGPFNVVPKAANLSCGKWTNRCLPGLLVHMNQS